jgi:nicotinate-nucleotide adenylyltransferase|nr:nicotinate (nicotinamide) nucleotide adenylyltransferase [Kofleriaceae bacterium]
MRVAIFGGSFNPPHAAHQLVALYVLETAPVDEVWLVPAYKHPFGKSLAPYEDRVAMCELAARALGPRAKVSRAEEELAQRPEFVASRTLDLVEHVAAAGHAPRLVIGADILHETVKWYRWDAVARIAPPIVVGRGGYADGDGVDDAAAHDGVHIQMPELSSTRIRELAAAGRHDELASLVPREVLRYIAEHRLYRT